MFNTNPATILAMTRIIVPFVLALAALLCSILVSLNIIGMASAVNNTETISTLKKTNTVNVVIAKGASFPDNKDFFVPSNLTIEGNTTVIWTNNDTVVHTATSGDPKKGPSSQFDSSIIESNKNYNHTFTNVGDFDYYCTLHPFMTGKITVTRQIKPMVTILAPEELPKTLNVTIAQDSSFPDNGKFFVPSEISIAPNGTVSWINEDNIIHAVTSGKPRQAPLGAFDSGVINAGSIFNHTFSKIGIFDYFDQIHPHMVGKVIAGLYTYNLKTNKGLSPLSFLITGNGNQIQKINLQSGSPMLEIRMLSPSPGNLTLVIPRTVLDKLDQNGKDDAFGLVGNRPVGFNESSTSPNSRTLAIQFDRGVNYIQILGTKSIESASKIEKSEPVIQNPSIVQSREATKPSGITDNTVINATMAGSNATALEKTAENTTMNGDVIDDGVATTSGGDSATISPGSSVPSNGKFFVPATLTVSTGTTVTWTNDDSTLHTVTSGSAESGNSGTEFDSSYLAAGKTFQHQFGTAGTFEYYCTLHPWMKGKVIVS